MPRRKPGWLKYSETVFRLISEKRYVNGLDLVSDPLPHPNDVREVLEQHFQVSSDRSFRLVLVEDYNDYKVFIQIPDGKSKYDFYVWRAIFENGRLSDVKVPTHDDLANFFTELKSKSNVIEEYLINAVIRLIRDRWGVQRIISHYFHMLKEDLKKEIGMFLSTLKWIALQEDINYPPKERKLGSKYTLAVYALLEAGFTMSQIRRVLRF